MSIALTLGRVRPPNIRGWPRLLLLYGLGNLLLPELTQRNASWPQVLRVRLYLAADRRNSVPDCLAAAVHQLHPSFQIGEGSMTLPEFPLRAYPESGLARRVSRVFFLHRKSEPACMLCPHCSGWGTGCAPLGRLEGVIAGFRQVALATWGTADRRVAQLLCLPPGHTSSSSPGSGSDRSVRETRAASRRKSSGQRPSPPVAILVQTRPRVARTPVFWIRRVWDGGISCAQN